VVSDGADSPASEAGIGGWLLLPALGLLLTPLRTGYGLYRDLWPVFSQGYWDVLTTPGSEAYHPYWAPLLLFEVSGNVFLIAATLVVMYFFFTKSRRAPRLMIAWLAFILVFVAADFFLSDLIPAVAEQDDPESAKELVRAAVGTAIWTPYFLVSKRVKATFTR
jgi:hypothetical protein